MRHMTRYALCVAAVVVASAMCATRAQAQAPTVDPRGSSPPAQPAPAPQPQEPTTVIFQGPQGPGQAGGQAPAEGQSGFYYFDENGGSTGSGGDQDGTFIGPVPPFHIVRRGDTLWDICWFYFNNPFEWPKVWSYNPSITNPHWIYPGDLVRLYPRGLDEPGDAAQSGAQPSDGTPGNDDLDGVMQPTPARQYGVSLRQLAFVDRDDLEFAGIVVGAVEEKSLLATGDSIYIEYKGKTPKVGSRYTIYTETTRVKHPDDGSDVGAYVRILGDLQITSVKKGKRVRAVITDSVDVIERGARVGPVERTLRTVSPTPNEKDLQGTIVAMLGADQLIGQGQVIVLDRGTGDGVKVGNRMYVIRRGDAYDDVMSPDHNVGQDDRRFPARAVGELVVVQAGKNASIALVTLALQEIGVGDRVLMRKSAR